jgi:DNA-binding MarR family transcriptional regulator
LNIPNRSAPVVDPHPYQGYCTAHQVRRLARTLTRVYDQEMIATGMTIGQFAVLRSLRHSTISLGQLARELGTDRTTLTRNLKPLIARGWISRKRGADGRTGMLSLTEPGLAQLRLARPVWKRVQQDIEQHFGATRVFAMHQAMESMRLSLEQAFLKERELGA